ncbi:hypothetical protein AYL99_11926 [Fonsecaea erecta]|uniref:Uncharacterized protein n=1 Tax=Fonsecaea erecta TaxID=1367422 RepID=A0A178Z2I4_9EURO|nr:hypothetical protein AYL99_11926 [Fonsecaea erecta]OAP53904.1 hypothetical protein AYL99_11926 [Fonsecaea erecta]
MVEQNVVEEEDTAPRLRMMNQSLSRHDTVEKAMKHGSGRNTWAAGLQKLLGSDIEAAFRQYAREKFGHPDVVPQVTELIDAEVANWKSVSSRRALTTGTLGRARLDIGVVTEA